MPSDIQLVRGSTYSNIMTNKIPSGYVRTTSEVKASNQGMTSTFSRLKLYRAGVGRTAQKGNLRKLLRQCLEELSEQYLVKKSILQLLICSII